MRARYLVGWDCPNGRLGEEPAEGVSARSSMGMEAAYAYTFRHADLAPRDAYLRQRSSLVSWCRWTDVFQWPADENRPQITAIGARPELARSIGHTQLV